MSVNHRRMKRISRSLASATSGHGQPSGARTIAADREAGIYALRGVVYGCSDRTGKRVRLGSSGSCVGTERAGPVALAAELAGYGLERCGVDTGFSQVL